MTRALAAVAVALGLLATGSCSAEREPATEPEPSGHGPQWELLPPGLETPRDDFGTAVVGGTVYVMGGMTGERGTRLDSIEAYDVGTNSWTTLGVEVPEGLASFETAAVGEDVYLFGGLDRNTEATDFSAVFDTATRTWERLPPLPHARYAHTVTAHDGRIYVIGGESVDGPVPQVDVFDPDSRTWSSGAPMPRARGSHDTVSTGELLYVLGGWLDAGPSDLVQTYDPDRDRWQTATRLPEPVSRAGAAFAAGQVWVSYHRFSASLDPGSGSWSAADPLTVSRHGLGYVAVDGAIYGIGGCTERPLRDVRTVDVLDLS